MVLTRHATKTASVFQQFEFNNEKKEVKATTAVSVEIPSLNFKAEAKSVKIEAPGRVKRKRASSEVENLDDVPSKIDAIANLEEDDASESNLTTGNGLKDVELANKTVKIRKVSKKASHPQKGLQAKIEAKSSSAGKTNKTKSTKKQTRKKSVPDGKVKLETEDDEEKAGQTAKVPKAKKAKKLLTSLHTEETLPAIRAKADKVYNLPFFWLSSKSWSSLSSSQH